MEYSARSVESVLSYCPQCVCTDTLQLIFNIDTCTYIYKCYLATYLINLHCVCMCVMSYNSCRVAGFHTLHFERFNIIFGGKKFDKVHET